VFTGSSKEEEEEEEEETLFTIKNGRLPVEASAHQSWPPKK